MGLACRSQFTAILYPLQVMLVDIALSSGICIEVQGDSWLPTVVFAVQTTSAMDCAPNNERQISNIEFALVFIIIPLETRFGANIFSIRDEVNIVMTALHRALDLVERSEFSAGFNLN